MPLEKVIGAHLVTLFPGMEILSWHTFRITRYSDLDVPAADEPEDLLATIEEQVFQRRFGEVVRLEVQTGMPVHIRQLLLDELREVSDPEVSPLADSDVHEPGQLLELGDLLSLASLELPELRDPAVHPGHARPSCATRRVRSSPRSASRPSSFTIRSSRSPRRWSASSRRRRRTSWCWRSRRRSTARRATARSSRRSPTPRSAASRWPCWSSCKARGDEANNIYWARTLENFGVHVAYGLPGLKTHAKIALVVRREPDGIRRYVHIGTGNYNARTARVYTDFGLLTCQPDVGADLSDVFNLLTGFSRQRDYRKVLVAPASMKARFIALIRREAEHAAAGRPSRIIAKLNALVSSDIITELYAASQAGVEIDLILRGICCLRPQLPGVSERIRVRSIIGRFLEHSRLFYFSNGGAEEFYIGSADWMPRNFERRVEVIVPVEERALQRRLLSLLQTCLADNRQAWELHPDGHYVQHVPGADEELATHHKLLRDPWGLDRADSRYTTSELRAMPKPTPPEGSVPPSKTNGHAPAAGARGKSARTTRR